MDTPTDALCVRPPEAARMLGISRTAIYAELASGRIRSAKRGKARLVPVSELHAWLDRQMEGQNDPTTKE